VAGKDNDAADALLRLDMEENNYDTKTWEKPMPRLTYQDGLTERIHMLPPMASEVGLGGRASPLAPDMSEYYQKKDESITKRLGTDKRLTLKGVGGHGLAHGGGGILVPKQLRQRVLDWYHTVLIHPGGARMGASIRSLYAWGGLRTDVQRHCKRCHKCQIAKESGKEEYGHLPPKGAGCLVWGRVDVDLWGPATVEDKDGETYQIHVMAMIDPATGWFGLATLGGGPTAAGAQRLLDPVWLARYPRPREIGFDGGGGSKREFRDLCKDMHLKGGPSAAWGPQSNPTLGRVHQVLGDCLRTSNLEEQDLDPNDPFGESPTATAYATRSPHHTTLGYPPAQLVFGRDMPMPVAFNRGWGETKENKQGKINKNNRREDSKREDHKYAPGGLTTLEGPGGDPKLSLPRLGPYGVIKHHGNGTATTQLSPYVTNRVDTRRLKPYYTSMTDEWIATVSMEEHAIHQLQSLAQGTGMVWR